MAYFKINNTDFSQYVNKLKIKQKAVYKSLTNAAGNTVVDYVNTKREIEVGIIPLNAAALKNLLDAISGFSVTISFLNPHNNTLENGVNAIIPESNIEYYTIQADNVSVKTFTLKFIEL